MDDPTRRRARDSPVHGDVLKYMSRTHSVFVVSCFVRSVPASSALTGVIPPEFVKLHHLRRLGIAENRIGETFYSIPPVVVAVTPFMRGKSSL